jgi:hypothetical protein
VEAFFEEPDPSTEEQSVNALEMIAEAARSIATAIMHHSEQVRQLTETVEKFVPTRPSSVRIPPV